MISAKAWVLWTSSPDWGQYTLQSGWRSSASAAMDPLGLRDGLPAGVDAADLARAQPDELAVAHEDDRVRDDAAHEPPGEIEVCGLPLRRCARAERRPFGGVVDGVVRVADQDR